MSFCFYLIHLLFIGIIKRIKLNLTADYELVPENSEGIAFVIVCPILYLVSYIL